MKEFYENTEKENKNILERYPLLVKSLSRVMPVEEVLKELVKIDKTNKYDISPLRNKTCLIRNFCWVSTPQGLVYWRNKVNYLSKLDKLRNMLTGEDNNIVTDSTAGSYED